MLRSFLSRLRKRLLGWKNKNLSIGGRLTLLNAILVNTQIFLFSFYKVPKCIIKEIINL